MEFQENKIGYSEAIDRVLSGSVLSRPKWGNCRIIRRGEERDRDHMLDVEKIEKYVIDDCQKRTCDCAISAFAPTQDDIQADDYYLVTVAF